MILDDIEPSDAKIADRVLSMPITPPVTHVSKHHRILLGTGLLALLLVVSALFFCRAIKRFWTRWPIVLRR
jgi:hypothetical protein